MRGFTSFAKAPPSEDELRRVMSRVWPVNVGIVAGNGLVIVEADSFDADREIERLTGGVRTAIREARAGRGRAWLFRADATQHLGNRAKLGDSKAIDVRAAGGLLVVPPSVHATGHRYTWTHPPWRQEIARLPQALFDMIRRVDSSAVAVRIAAVLDQPSSRVLGLLACYAHMDALWNGIGKRRGDDSASGYDFSLALALLDHRVPADEVATAMRCRPGAHRRDDAYVVRTVQRAVRLRSAR